MQLRALTGGRNGRRRVSLPRVSLPRVSPRSATATARFGSRLSRRPAPLALAPPLRIRAARRRLGRSRRFHPHPVSTSPGGDTSAQPPPNRRPPRVPLAPKPSCRPRNVRDGAHDAERRREGGRHARRRGPAERQPVDASWGGDSNDGYAPTGQVSEEGGRRGSWARGGARKAAGASRTLETLGRRTGGAPPPRVRPRLGRVPSHHRRRAWTRLSPPPP